MSISRSGKIRIALCVAVAVTSNISANAAVKKKTLPTHLGAPEWVGQPGPSQPYTPGPMSPEMKLVRAIVANNQAGVLAALKAGAQLNKSASGYPPIFQAVSEDHLPMLQFLLDHGGSVNATAGDGTTMLDAATASDMGDHPSEQVVRFLLDHGAHVVTPNGRGEAHLPAAWACLRWASLDLIKSFRAKGADYDHPLTDGTSAFYFTVQNPHRDVFEYFLPQYHGELSSSLMMTLSTYPYASDRFADLIDHGAKVDQPMSDGNVLPIDYAVGCGNIPMIKTLLAHGAKLSSSPYALFAVINTPAGNLDLVKELVEKGALVDPPGVEHRPIDAAAQTKRLDIVQFLLDKGASPNATKSDNEAPLILACSGDGDDTLAIVKLLIDRGADVNVNDDLAGSSPGDTPTRIGDPLLCAYESHHWDVAEYLLDHGAKPHHMGMTVDAIARDSTDADATAAAALLIKTTKPAMDDINLSSAFGKPKLLKLLLDNGASPDSMALMGYSCLQQAIQNGDIADATTLLNHGATVDKLDADGNTPLIVAVIGQNPRIAKLLIDHGASLNAKDQSGHPVWALMAASHDPLMRKLAAGHHSVGASDAHGRTALMLAAQAKDAATIVKLIAQGANPNQADKDGLTALDYVPWESHTDTRAMAAIKALIAHGANVNLSGPNVVTPAMVYATLPESTALEFLSTLGCDINKPGLNGDTPLMRASTRPAARCVIYLIDHGATVDQRNSQGDTALTTAMARFVADDVGNVQLRKMGATDDELMDDDDPNGSSVAADAREVIRQLIHAGADVNLKGSSGKSFKDYLNDYDDPKLKKIVAPYLK